MTSAGAQPSLAERHTAAMLPAVSPQELANLGKGEKVIFDTDMGQLNDDSISLFMLTQSGAEILGVTTVTGNTWTEEGTAYSLRQLERVGRTDIPVIQGLADPILGSRQHTLTTENDQFGHRLRGAWRWAEPADYRSLAEERSPYGGYAATEPLDVSAPDFIVNQIKANPGEVTLLVTGPETNIATVVKNHPEVVPLVKQIIYMGGAFDVPGNVGPGAELNIWIDPEATRMTWEAPWPKQTIIALDVTNTVQYGITEYNRIIGGANTTITQQFKDVQGPQFAENPARLRSIYDTLTVALLFDPTLVTKSEERYVTTDTNFGLNYGRTMGYLEKDTPPGLRKAEVVQLIDNARFFDMFTGLLGAPINGQMSIEDAMITATTTPQTCSPSGESVPGSLTLHQTGIGSAYVYVGEKTGTKAGDLSSLAAGKYLIIATAKDGYAFNTVPNGWKPSPTKDTDGNTVKVSRVVEVGATDCSK